MNAIDQPRRSAQENDSKRINPVLNRYFLFLLISVCAVACQWEETPPYQTPPPVTEILRVEYKPMQIHTGDSVTFKVVIKDSLLSGLLYRWYAANQLLVESTTPTTKVLIELPPRNYTFDIFVLRPNSHTTFVAKSFQVEVLP